MKASRLRTVLRSRLGKATTRSDILVVPGVYDPLSAKLAESAGFEAVHVGSYSLACAMGLPDVGLLGLAEIAARTAEISEAVDIPVIADAETGFYETGGIPRVVRFFERAGAAAIHIEDLISGKHGDGPRAVMSTARATERIRAAVDAREDPNFLIVARTDVAWATGRSYDASERVQAFHDAGADAVMPMGLTLAELKGLRADISSPIFIVNANDSSDDEAAAGVNASIHNSLCIDTISRALATVLAEFKTSGSVAGVRPRLASRSEVEAPLGYGEYKALNCRYRS